MNEKISSLVDQELHRAERGRVYAALAEDPEARATWERYYTIRAVLRREVEWTVSAGFGDRIAEQIALEDQPRPAATWMRGRRGWASRLAIAASVATVALLGLRVTDRQPSLATPAVVASALPAPDAPVQNASLQRIERWNQLSPRAQRRLNGLLLEHSQFSPEAGADSLIGYVRIVGFDRSVHPVSKPSK
ncbi:MAG TPA: sigma-E factor negative regulatory protein [Acidiferrobacteraceae bacterium]|nr:sigma-E factor negative regulatory protein [Acidiferrobacteraceae bacterium]